MKTALITGGGTGIGRASALAFARAGYAVAIAGRRMEKLREVVQAIEAAGGRALAVAADVADESQVRGLVAQTIAAFGRIDVLINNAGNAPVATIAELTSAQWRELVDVNVSAVLYATRAVWPFMEKQNTETAGNARDAGTAGGGTIINLSSMASRDPFPGLGVYGAAKLAVNMLTLVTAREGASAGIRAYAIAPGAVDTAMLAGVLGGKKLPAEAMLRPEEVAALSLEMAEGSPRYANGETVFLSPQRT